MPFFPSLPPDSGPPAVYTRYPEIYGPWSKLSEVLMNGPSPLTEGQRELLFAYAAGLTGCQLVHVAHSEVAYAHGVARGSVESLLEDPESTAVERPLRPLVAFVRKLMLTPAAVAQSDADAVFAAGWDERALHDTIAVVARAAFMVRLVQGHGFAPITRADAAARAQRRLKHGYVNLYPAFRDGAQAPAGPATGPKG